MFRLETETVRTVSKSLETVGESDVAGRTPQVGVDRCSLLAFKGAGTETEYGTFNISLSHSIQSQVAGPDAFGV